MIGWFFAGMTAGFVIGYVLSGLILSRPKHTHDWSKWSIQTLTLASNGGRISANVRTCHLCGYTKSEPI